MIHTKYLIGIYKIINQLVHVYVENDAHLIFKKLTSISLEYSVIQ